MRKYIFLFISVLPFIFFACSYGSSVSKKVIVSGYDFRPYTEHGFLFTPEQYSGDYKSIGLISVEIIPTVYQIAYGTKSNKEGWKNNPRQYKTLGSARNFV